MRFVIIVALALVPWTRVNAVNSGATLDRLLCPAELVVIRADARLRASDDLEPHLNKGLENRIAAAIATLPYICRRYVAIVPQDAGNRVDTAISANPTEFLSGIRELASLTRNPTRLVARLDKLIERAPFLLDRFKLDRAGDADESEMASVYQQYCHGCHASTDMASENPAYSLKTMAREQDDEEFFARMLLGVRGTQEIGLSNPLTPMEIGALARHLRND